MNVSRASRFARGTRRTTRRRDSHVRSILWHARTFFKIIEPFQEPPEVPPCLRKETTCAKKNEFVSVLMNTLSGIFF